MTLLLESCYVWDKSIPLYSGSSKSGTYLQGGTESNAPSNDNFCMFLPPNLVTSLDIYLTK